VRDCRRKEAPRSVPPRPLQLLLCTSRLAFKNKACGPLLRTTLAHLELFHKLVFDELRRNRLGRPRGLAAQAALLLRPPRDMLFVPRRSALSTSCESSSWNTSSWRAQALLLDKVCLRGCQTRSPPFRLQQTCPLQRRTGPVRRLEPLPGAGEMIQ